MNGPLISIIIPAFNAESVIAATLESAQNQTYSHFEAIIVDDGSTDRTAEVVEDFIRVDARFKLIHQKNGGVSAARNAALTQARGEWIAFLDADDLWLPEKLSRQLDLTRERPELNLLFTDYIVWDGTKDGERRFPKREKFPTGDVCAALAYYNLFGMSCVMVHRKVLFEAGEFDPAVAPAEDWDMWLRIADKKLLAGGIWEPLVRYRIWSGNASKNTLRMLQSNIRVLEKAVARTTSAAQRSDYVRALQIARGNFEMASSRASIPQEPAKVSAAILRAWKHCPGRVKWFFWYLGTVWPKVLGGTFFTAVVHRKIQSKW